MSQRLRLRSRPITDLTRWLLGERWLYAAALLRVGFGLTLLFHLSIMYGARHYVWGPDAFVPWAPLGEPGHGGFYALSAAPLWFEAVLALTCVSLMLWVLGWRTRVMGVVVYALIRSLFERNPAILDGGDNLLIIALFLLMFARTDAVLAPARAGPPRNALVVRSTMAEAERLLHSSTMLAILIQVCLLYFSSGLAKVAGERWQEGTALYYILRVQEFAWPPLSPLIYGNAALVTVLSYLSVLDQLAYPFMLLNRVAKRVAVAVTIGMHVGIALLMGLLTFSMIMIVVQALVFSDSEYRAATRWLLARTRWLRATAVRRMTVNVFGGSWRDRAQRVRRSTSALDWLQTGRRHDVRDPDAPPLTEPPS